MQNSQQFSVFLERQLGFQGRFGSVGDASDRVMRIARGDDVLLGRHAGKRLANQGLAEGMGSPALLAIRQAIGLPANRPAITLRPDL